MFINFSNHPSDKWCDRQLKAARKYGNIMDIPFPEVSASGDEAYIKELAAECVERIAACRPEAVLCQGEFCLAYEVITRLKARGLTVLAACSERKVMMEGNKKTVIFEFERFRRY